MLIPLRSVLSHTTLTYVVGSALMVLAMPLLGFVAGIVAVLQRLDLISHRIGDGNWQIALDFGVGVVGVLLLFGVYHWFRRPLWRLFRGDLRLIQMIARAVARSLRKRTPWSITATPDN